MDRRVLTWFVFACGLLLSVVEVGSAQGQPAGPGRVQRSAARAGAPFPPLNAEHEKYLMQILKYWEHTTSQTKRYRCKFKRWEYDPALKTYSAGVIKYAAPDKGLFQVDSLQERKPPNQPGAEPQWVPQAAAFREHWVCDGKSIFEFDHQNKQLKKRRLPPEMQGSRITDGPLPFMFGATAEQIRNRFWVRVVDPQTNAENEFWLEAFPKTREDAANFERLNIILDGTDFLPKGMVLYHRNNAQTTFAFEQRETNWSILREQLNPFLRQFYEPKTPSGWKKVEEPIGGGPAIPAAGAARQAQRGRGLLPRR